MDEQLALIKENCRVDPVTECWEWLGCRQSNGYGRIKRKGKTQYTHRYIYQNFKGEIPKGHDVCHECDNRPCCNPDHLFTGTRKINMRDAVAKNRQAKGEILSGKRRGELSSSAKLNKHDVIAIRSSAESGMSAVDIARSYSCTESNITKIIARLTWRHL